MYTPESNLRTPLHEPKQLATASNGTPPPQAKDHAQIIRRFNGKMADQSRQREAGIRFGLNLPVQNDLVQVWNRDQPSNHHSPQDQLFVRLRSSDEGKDKQNLQEGANASPSTQSWQSMLQIHVPASGNEAGAAGEGNALLSD